MPRLQGAGQRGQLRWTLMKTGAPHGVWSRGTLVRAPGAGQRGSWVWGADSQGLPWMRTLMSFYFEAGSEWRMGAVQCREAPALRKAAPSSLPGP